MVFTKRDFVIIQWDCLEEFIHEWQILRESFKHIYAEFTYMMFILTWYIYIFLS